MGKFKSWEEIEKGFNFTEEETLQMEIEKQIIETIIKTRKENNMSQQELSKKTGIAQPAIARIESGKHSISTNTLIKLLVPMGYTLKIVPIDRKLN